MAQEGDLASPGMPIVVVEDRGHIVAFASTSTYCTRACYAGIAEFSVYVARAERGRGAGRVAMQALIAASGPAGIWKLVSRIFVENAASRKLMASVGFREVGIYSSKGQLYEPVDRESLLYYHETKDGQILEEGINEAGAFQSGGSIAFLTAAPKGGTAPVNLNSQPGQASR
mgnify:CR=1 FL=1